MAMDVDDVGLFVPPFLNVSLREAIATLRELITILNC